MLFRWLHERIAFKPYRPLVERGMRLGAAMVGWIGSCGRAVWRALRRLPSPPPFSPMTIRHLVVIRADRIGDVVLSTPAFRALRSACPQARFTVITSPVTAPLVMALSYVDDIVVIPGDRFLDWWRTRSALRALRDVRPDAVFVLQSAWPAAWLAWWLGATHRIGYDLFGMGWLLTHAVPYPFLSRKVHQVEANLHLLQAVGIPVPPRDRAVLEVSVSETAQRAARTWLQEHGCAHGKRFVIIHPGSRSRYTQWDPKRFAIVADRVARETHSTVIVLCGPHEEPIVERMRSAMQTSPLIAKELSLSLMTALLQRCDLFIGNATGTMHLASAVCPRVIAIIGGTHPHDCPERWGPWGNAHRVVHRKPEEVIGRSTWEWVGPEGLQHISPDDVMAVVQAQLAPSVAQASQEIPKT